MLESLSRERAGKERQAAALFLLCVTAQAPAKGQSESTVGPRSLSVFPSKLQVGEFSAVE